MRQNRQRRELLRARKTSPTNTNDKDMSHAAILYLAVCVCDVTNKIADVTYLNGRVFMVS